MTTAAGRVLKKGRIRVDARKAMAKLREHLLVDLHLYAVEVVRAAVLAGATRVDVTYDADDVEVTFDGAPLPAAALPHLFEHLTGEDSGAHDRRLLALAVNAALGLDPAWVSLTTSIDGAVARVAWSPALVAAIEREEQPLPEPEVVPAPPGMPATGTRFHLRRKVGWETVRRATAKVVPREVALLTGAAHCLRVPLRVNGEAVAPSGRAVVLARVPIRVPGARRAHVEVTTGHETAPHVDFCELGLLLCRTSFAFGRHFPMAEHQGVRPPVRIVIDSDALPTNASRSAVREDAPLFASLASNAAPALADALAGMAASLFGRGEVPEGITIDTSNAAALHDALGAFLCAAEASLVARVTMPEALRSLLELPLFQDGLGRPLSHATIPREDPLLVWTGKEPVPAPMEPWAEKIVWRRGRVAERILQGRSCFPPEQLADLARRGEERHRKMLAMPPGPVAVPDDTYLARASLRFDEGPFAGLSMEIAILADPSAYVRNLALRVFVQGRLYEAYPLPEDRVPLPCVVALQWPGHILPRLGYEGIEPTHGTRAALALAVRQAVFLAERVAAGRAREGLSFDTNAAAVLRAALATAVTAPARMYSVEGFEMPALADLQGLVRAPVWPTTEGTLVSLQDLCEYVARTGAVCVAAPGMSGRAPDGRPVIAARADEVDQLSRCLRSGVAIVRYDTVLSMRPASGGASRLGELIDLVNRDALGAGAPILHIEEQGTTCAVTLGDSGQIVWHAGVRLTRNEVAESFGGITIAIDDASIVPTVGWNGVFWATDQAIAGRAERAFAERVVEAIQGDERARRQLHRRIPAPQEGTARAPAPPQEAARYEWPDQLTALPCSVQRFLVDRAARAKLPEATDEDRALAQQIEQIPFLTMIRDGEPAPASLAEVDAVHKAPFKVPCLDAAPPFRPARWRPLVVRDAALREALGRWSGGRARDASSDLFEQRRVAEQEWELAQLRERPVVDGKVPGVRADLTCPTVHLEGSLLQKIGGVAAALPIAGLDLEYAPVEVTFESRPVFEQALGELRVPVVARVDLLDRLCLDGVERLSPRGIEAVSARVIEAANELAVKLLARAREPDAARTFFGDARALRLVDALLSRTPRDPRIDEGLRGNVLRWPTVQGDGRLFGELRLIDGELWVGADVYSSWVTASPPTDLDRPILHVPPTPEGVLLTSILQKLGLKLRVVTDAIAALQIKRSRGAGDGPRLAARPPHPALVRALHHLLVEGVEGEVGLYESGEALLELSSLDGDTRRIPLDLSFPARAVARMDVLTQSSVPIVAQKITRAAVRFLVSLVGSLDDLPLYVRAHLRTLTCRAVQHDREIPAPARTAPIFPDIDGRFWSIDDLRSGEHGDWSCTFDPPPYPRARQEGHTLRLTPTEHLLLHEKVKVLNVTEWMRRDLDAERRREAPQVAEVRFSAAARAQLVSSFLVSEGSMEGEIGLLRPAVDEARGIQVFTTRRPVCLVQDAPGWPLAAVINDDTLRPNRWWTELLPADETRLRARVRSLATNHMRVTHAAQVPADALASTFVDDVVPPVAAYGSTETMTCTGHLWLPARWPASPSVRLFVQRIEQPADSPISIASAVIQPTLPLCGVLFLSHAAPVVTAGAASRAALALRDAAAKLLAPLVQKNTEDPEIRTYQWNLALLGSTAVGEPAAVAADGRAITADQVIAALHDRKEIWLTDRQGSIEGDFPEGAAPPFVLVDDGSPLVRVLKARLPGHKLRWLGASRPVKAAALSAADALAPPSVPPLAPPPPLDDVTPAPPFRSWLADLIDRVRVFLGSAPLSRDEATGIGDAVERTLRALRLRDEPVITVHEVTRGRLVRYDQGRRVVSINVAHPSLAPHLASPSEPAIRRACIALVAAALSEVNIALENVTDHDEEQALLELLRQEAAAPAAPAPAPAQEAG